ncbi:hypothetical protein [Streptomyces sp. NPDC087300]|uniref:hypothetical protein n=1 Tax=Streptomyces sp. NPDC087300 TaxID=3365780 RepID=UPI00382A371E
MVIRINEAELARVLTGPGGPVYREVRAEAHRVRASIARHAPKDSGKMARSFLVRMSAVPGRSVTATVYTRSKVATYQQRGTRPHGPVRAKVLRFKPKGGGGVVFTPWVDGVPATHFITKGLLSAAKWRVRVES